MKAAAAPDTTSEPQRGIKGSRNFNHKREITTKLMKDQNIRSPIVISIHSSGDRLLGLDGSKSEPSNQVLVEDQ